MKHLSSKKVGRKAEENLLKIVEGNKNKTKYIKSTIHKFSEKQNKLLVFKDDVDTLKYFLKINIHSFYTHINSSENTNEVINHLRNAVHTRYMEFIRKYKIPLNGGKK